MRKTTVLWLFLTLALVTLDFGCATPSPTPTPPPQIIILTIITEFGFFGLPVQQPMTNVEVAGQWERDALNLGVVRGRNTFFQGNSGLGKLLVPDARTPAFWRLGEFSGPCAEQTFEIGIRQNDGVVMDCDTTRPGPHLGLNFEASPPYVDPASPPGTMTITGQDMDTTYGMPMVEYYDVNGNLFAQTQAFYVAPDGTSLTASAPDFSSCPTSQYLVVVSNVDPNGLLVIVGSTTIDVFTPDPPPPPPPDPGPCGDGPCLIY